MRCCGSQSPAGSDEMRWKTWEGLPLLLEETAEVLIFTLNEYIVLFVS